MEREETSAAEGGAAPRFGRGSVVADPLRGLFEVMIDGKPAVVEYEPDTELRDTEQIPLQEPGGIVAFL